MAHAGRFLASFILLPKVT